LAQFRSSLWISIRFEYATEEVLELTEDTLEEFLLTALDLPLGSSMLMSSDTLLVSLRLDIAEGVKLYLFAISLLGATIQDGGIEERSDDLVALTCIIHEYGNL